MENKYLKVRKETFLEKVKNFIKGIFNKNLQEDIKETEKEILENISNEDVTFLEQIKVDKYEEVKISDIQELYESEEISLSEMSDEELHELKLLYKKQIEDIKRELENKRNEYIFLKNKLAKNS